MNMLTESAADPSIRIDWTHPAVAWLSALAANAVHVQRLQIEAMLFWQAETAAIHNEIWDEWRCRFAGGVPIDG